MEWRDTGRTWKDESGLSSMVRSGENEKSKNSDFFGNSVESEEDLSEESEEKSSEETKEHATKEDLEFLSLIQSKDDDSALDTLDYFLRNSDIWDDSEEYDLLETDSAEQDYYNYYYWTKIKLVNLYVEIMTHWPDSENILSY